MITDSMIANARPSSDPATITVKSFYTSLPYGQLLVNFTASARSTR